MKHKTKVMGFGTFDELHPGHVAFLRQLLALGDELWVVVARDQNVKKLKGHSPRQTETERQAAVLKTGLTDHVILGDLHDVYQCLLDHQPDVIGLGYDQAADPEEIQKRLPNARFVRLKSFKPEIYKSSLIKQTK
ncbi:MAG: adenylyltransferase/cytidyltransferase family protein [Candidatus Peregrinibacteria bacterium]